MSNKKPQKPNNDEQDALEHRVEVMMDPALPDPQPPVVPQPIEPLSSPKLAPLDIFKDVSSAPELSPPLRKKVMDMAKPVAPSPQANPLSQSANLASRMKGISAPVEPDPPAEVTQKVAAEPVPGLIAMTKSRPAPATQAPVQSVLAADDSSMPDAQLDDEVSDAAVDAITAEDADKILEIEDAAAGRRPVKAIKSGNRFGGLFRRKLTYLVIALLLILAIFIVPSTRYKLLGLVLKKTYTITLSDATTHSPVSDAAVHYDGHTSTSNAAGKVSIIAPVGPLTFSVSKQYYQSADERVVVGIGAQRKPLAINLTATGRQVAVVITNKISGQPLGGAEIAVLNTTAHTSSNGTATIVLPTQSSSYPVSISAQGFNNSRATIYLSPGVSGSNTFGLIPNGKIVFLTGTDGSVAVNESNLDGSDATTLVGGTASETAASTQLFSSSDWRYEMLFAQRSATAAAGLYLVNPQSNSNPTTIEEDNNTITPIGWSNHYFIYEVENTSQPNYQPGYFQLKSYDADSGHTAILDQSDAIGSQSDFAYQVLGNFYIYNGKLLYTKVWQGAVDNYASSNVTSSINSISADGENQEPFQQFPMAATGSTLNAISDAVYGPGEVYFDASFTAASDEYFSYSDDSLTPATITSSTFSNSSYTGTPSPSGTLLATGVIRSGQYVLTTTSATDPSAPAKPVATLSSTYRFYGWYTDDYMIVSSKNTLYILPVTGLSPGQQPLKVTDYL